MVVRWYDQYLTRIKAGEITPVSLSLGRVPGGYSIYGYRCCYVTFSDGTHFSTSNWMYPESKKTIRELEQIFKIKMGENRAPDLPKTDPQI